MKNNFYDVIIIGSGPAGSSSAYFLSAQGFKVLVIEKEILPRYKTCGGGVVQRVAKLFPFSFEEVSDVQCFTTEVFDIRANRHFVTRRDKPIIYMTMRNEFDYLILSKAKAAGAMVLENTEATDLITGKESVDVLTKDDKYTARFVIGADGAGGICSKILKLKLYLIKLPALEYEIYTGDSMLDKFNKSARFDFDIIPNGYGWVFPKKDHLSIGVVEMKKGKKELNKLFDIYLKLLGITNVQRYERHGYFVPLIKGNNLKFAKDRIFLTGDAAGFADPVTAEGISSAVLSGKIAADTINESYLNPGMAADLYNYKINHSIIDELRFSKIIAALVYTYPAVRGLLFRFYGQKLSELITDIFMGEKKYHDLLTDPLNYYKLIKYLLKDDRKL